MNCLNSMLMEDKKRVRRRVRVELGTSTRVGLLRIIKPVLVKVY